jgi:hypothetical protein
MAAHKQWNTVSLFIGTRAVPSYKATSSYRAQIPQFPLTFTEKKHIIPHIIFVLYNLLWRCTNETAKLSQASEVK